ncbi:MAG: glycosyltransferase family 9 protein [Chloroflexota bacterium]|nr:MAG: hypothetical protein DLM70_12190 [Chloroflexota bacterium]
MEYRNSTHLFLVGRDYHLGDLLWLTAVLAEYRRQIQPARIVVACPNRPIARILEHNPWIDGLLRGEASSILAAARKGFGPEIVLHDLRILPLGVAMVREWRYRLPWLYYRDLWLEGRGQWLATFLRLGPLTDFRPILELREEDREFAGTLTSPYVVLAPHVGHYTLPLASVFWHRVKGWEKQRWVELAGLLRKRGYQPLTLAGPGQQAIPDTMPLIGLPMRQVAGLIDRAAALITVESGLWFIAAARCTPFVIVPWWLPRSVDWPAHMKVPHRLVYRRGAAAADVLRHVCQLASGNPE